jgi:hypothetical protein
MKPIVALLSVGCLASHWAPGAETAASAATQELTTRPADSPGQSPIGSPGRTARYHLTAGKESCTSTVTNFMLALGPIEPGSGADNQWLHLDAAKADGKSFRLWVLVSEYPPQTSKAASAVTSRYILQESGYEPTEFQNAGTGQAVLPSIGGWQYLWPRSIAAPAVGGKPEIFPERVTYLGLTYHRAGAVETAPAFEPPEHPKRITLQPDVLVGLPSNTRQKDEKRRYDNSEYEYLPLTREDYCELVQAGMTCLRVNAEQLPRVEDLNTFYWGLGPAELPYPECLYRSSYLGPTLFIDEPAVGTRDHVIRPRLAKDPAFRKSVDSQAVLTAFQEYLSNALSDGAPAILINSLKHRTDLDLGAMSFKQENLFSWETIVASAAFQLSQDPFVPAAMVFEPPGRVGTLRTLPELDMTYGCQIPVDDPKNLTSIIYGFLRGAARLTDKAWGTSIYGGVDRTDAFWFLTHAYDLGATRFFFWDNAKLACVPYGECLALARNLQAHALNHPGRDLPRLKRSAEVAILLPPGYNLGHVHLGRGNLWGLPELNLERVNRAGVKYRTVMENFFVEIERCLRLGVSFDLLWDLPEIHPSGYREIVRIREDGKVEVMLGGKISMLDHARMPARPEGRPPALTVKLSTTEGTAPLEIRAQAEVAETSAPVYYTYGADADGVYRNALVAWELYGPGEEDYRALMPEGLKPTITKHGSNTEVTVSFSLRHPGSYRLRAATVDLAGRSTVTWTPITVTK